MSLVTEPANVTLADKVHEVATLMPAWDAALVGLASVCPLQATDAETADGSTTAT
jgi:hypothetical protein